MDTNAPQNKSQSSNTQIHNGDVNSTGVHVENMNFQRGDDGDDVVRSLNRQMSANRGQRINRGGFR
jgi:hypothetical protein